MLSCHQNNSVVTAHRELALYGGYSCPSCHKELMLKSGGCNKPHFSHLVNQGCKHRDATLKRTSPKPVDEPRKLIMKGIELLVEGVLLTVENQRGSKS